MQTLKRLFYIWSAFWIIGAIIFGFLYSIEKITPNDFVWFSLVLGFPSSILSGFFFSYLVKYFNIGNEHAILFFIFSYLFSLLFWLFIIKVIKAWIYPPKSMKLFLERPGIKEGKVYSHKDEWLK